MFDPGKVRVGDELRPAEWVRHHRILSDVVPVLSIIPSHLLWPDRPADEVMFFVPLDESGEVRAWFPATAFTDVIGDL